MLTHSTLGPTALGHFLVTYQTPGCTVPTVAGICRTQQQADDEAGRLNADQAQREKAMQRRRELLGLRSDYPAPEVEHV